MSIGNYLHRLLGKKETAAKLAYFIIQVYFLSKIILVEIFLVKELIISIITVFIIIWILKIYNTCVYIHMIHIHRYISMIYLYLYLICNGMPNWVSHLWWFPPFILGREQSEVMLSLLAGVKAASSTKGLPGGSCCCGQSLIQSRSSASVWKVNERMNEWCKWCLLETEESPSDF